MKHRLLLIALLLFCLPVLAQDLTLEPAPAATVDAPVVINIETPAEPVDTPATPVLSLSNIIAFLLGGVITAAGFFAWLGNQARAAMQDPAKMILAEKLGDSVPKEHADKLIDGLNGIIVFLKEATDRQPMIMKPVPPTDQFTSTSSQ